MARQITLSKFECGIQELKRAEDGRYDLIRTPICIVEDSSMTKSEIRKAIIAAGVECPRGSDVYKNCIGKVMYYFETEDLKRIATKREELAD